MLNNVINLTISTGFINTMSSWYPHARNSTILNGNGSITCWASINMRKPNISYGNFLLYLSFELPKPEKIQLTIVSKCANFSQ